MGFNREVLSTHSKLSLLSAHSVPGFELRALPRAVSLSFRSNPRCRYGWDPHITKDEASAPGGPAKQGRGRGTCDLGVCRAQRAPQSLDPAFPPPPAPSPPGARRSPQGRDRGRGRAPSPRAPPPSPCAEIRTRPRPPCTSFGDYSSALRALIGPAKLAPPPAYWREPVRSPFHWCSNLVPSSPSHQVCA